MRNLIELITKNCKILFRNKSSTLIFILGPLLVVLILGFAFNSADLYGLKLATYSPQYSPLTDSLLNKLSSQFTIIKTSTQQTCIDGVKLSEWHVCLVFPANFDINKNNNVDFYVNPTKINLVYIITNMISAKVGEQTTEISKGLVEALLKKMETVKAEADKSSAFLDSITAATTAIKDSSSKLNNDFASLKIEFNETGLNTSGISGHLRALRTSASRIGVAKENISDTEIQNIISSAYSNVSGEITILMASVSNLEESVQEARDTLGNVTKTQASAKASLSTTLLQIDSALADIKNMDSSFKMMEEQLVVGLDASKLVSPITTSIKEVTTEKRYISFIFPILLVMMLMFGGIFFGSSLVVSEKTSRAYFRNLLVPVRKITFITAAYITTMLILAVETGIIFGVVYFFTKSPVKPELIGTLALIASVFVFIGLLIGYVSRNSEVSMLISIAVVALFMFFSNLILPIETIAYLREVAVYNPFTIASNIIKESMLLSIGYQAQTKYIIVLFSYLAIAFIASLLAQKASKRHAS
ncbi:MAG: ABC transporter permease [archaeon]